MSRSRVVRPSIFPTQSDTPAAAASFSQRIVEVGGVEDDRLVGPLGPDLPGGLDAVDAGHLVVDHHHLGVGLGDGARPPPSPLAAWPTMSKPESSSIWTSILRTWAVSSTTKTRTDMQGNYTVERTLPAGRCIQVTS